MTIDFSFFLIKNETGLNNYRVVFVEPGGLVGFREQRSVGYLFSSPQGMFSVSQKNNMEKIACVIS